MQQHKKRADQKVKDLKKKATEVTDKAERKVKKAQELKHKRDKEEVENLDSSA